MRHNLLPPLNYASEVVKSWLAEIPIALQLVSFSPQLSDDTFVELQEDCFGQKHSILLRDLHKIVNYHKLAAEISTTKAEKEFYHVFYAG